MNQKTRAAVWAVTSAVLAGLVGGALTGGSAIPDSRSGDGGPDTIPVASDLARESMPDAVRALAATGFISVGAPQQPGTDGRPPADAAWVLRGIALGASPNAMFQGAADAQPQLLVVGDSLPDGRKIVAIEPDRVLLMSGSCRSEIRLFSPLVPAVCPSPPAATQ